MLFLLFQCLQHRQAFSGWSHPTWLRAQWWTTVCSPALDSVVNNRGPHRGKSFHHSSSPYTPLSVATGQRADALRSFLMSLQSWDVSERMTGKSTGLQLCYMVQAKPSSTWQKLRNWLWTWGGIEDWKPLFPSMGVFVGTVDNYNTSVFTMAMNWTSFKSQKPSTRRVISTITIAIFWDDWGPLTSTGRCSGCYISQLWSVLSVLSMLWCAWKEPESSGHQQTQ